MADAGCIFLNYRREESQWVAGRLHDRLAAVFGADRIFTDVDSIGWTSTCRTPPPGRGPDGRRAGNGTRNRVLADIVIRAVQAACSYALRIPPRRWFRRISRWAIWSGSVIGGGSGRSGRAFAMPWWGRWVL